MLAFVALAFWVVSRQAGAWGVPYFSFTSAHGSRCTNGFTGYTCTNCRWMEANVFPQKEIQKQLAKYVRVKLYTDGEGEIYERQQKMEQQLFGTVALPGVTSMR